MKIKIIIFDLDGTLVDAYEAVQQSLNHALEQFNYSLLDLETVRRNVGWGERILFQRFVKEEDLDKVHSVFRQHHPKALKSKVQFLPGAKEIIKYLKDKGYSLAIASNRPTRFTEIILKHLRVRDCFSHVLCADKVENPKPAADLLNQVLKQSSLQKEEALYVGDMTIDVETGKRAEVRTVAVVTGSSTKDEIQALEPFRIIEHLNELKSILLGS